MEDMIQKETQTKFKKSLSPSFTLIFDTDEEIVNNSTFFFINMNAAFPISGLYQQFNSGSFLWRICFVAGASL